MDMSELPVFELLISDDLESDLEVNMVSFVDKPAIEKNFLAFNEVTQANELFVTPRQGEDEQEYISRCISVLVGDEGYEEQQAAAICYSTWEKKDEFADSYSDYPDAVKNNARSALKYAEENGWGSCGTPVGKIRANQLANGEAISLDTIKRMYSFLSRHKENAEKSKGYGDGCGQLMYDAWGGASALSWAESKIKAAEKMSMHFAIESEEQRIVSGALILADTKIYRRDADGGEYYVTFPKETIKKLVLKFFKKGFQTNVNIMHTQGAVMQGVTMFESWIIDKERGIMPMKGFESVTDGSWFGSFKVENDEVWNMIKSGEVKGFSVEGMFNYSVSKDEMLMQQVYEILNNVK